MASVSGAKEGICLSRGHTSHVEGSGRVPRGMPPSEGCWGSVLGSGASHLTPVPPVGTTTAPWQCAAMVNRKVGKRYGRVRCIHEVRKAHFRVG